MTTPNFDDLIGGDVESSERDRLRRVHELLVTAGPPAELPPHIEAGPTLAMTLARRPRRGTRKLALLAATICVLLVAFLFGYLAGNRGGGLASGHTIAMSGTSIAPNALASLRVLPADTSGNWPMRLTGTGLPTLGPRGYYEVYLVRNGKLFAPCGSFISSSPSAGIDVTLNAPYHRQPHDTWVVVKQVGGHEPGPVVLRPTIRST
jgi:hypothetical protein